MTKYSDRAVAIARFIRVGTIRNALQQNLLTREDALELLTGCLEPGDESTRRDDRELLDKSAEEVMTILGIQVTDVSHES